MSFSFVYSTGVNVDGWVAFIKCQAPKLSFTYEKAASSSLPFLVLKVLFFFLFFKSRAVLALRERHVKTGLTGPKRSPEEGERGVVSSLLRNALDKSYGHF